MMDNFEIVTSFLSSADKRRQITVLAELNACTEEEIVSVLDGSDRVRPKMLSAWKIAKAQKEAHKRKREAAKAAEAEKETEPVKAPQAPAPVQESAEETRPVQERSPIITWGTGPLVTAYAKMRGMSGDELVRLCKDVSALLKMEKAIMGGAGDDA